MTFAELVLESIEDNYHHTGIVTNIDHDNKIIHINPNKSHILNIAREYAKRGAISGGIAGALGGGLAGSINNGELVKAFNSKYDITPSKSISVIGLGGLGGAGVGILSGGINGALTGLYRRKKEKEQINQLLRAGYKIQYDE